MSSRYQPTRPGTNSVLSRAFAASAGLCVATALATGFFITKIVHASAAPSTTGTATGTGNFQSGSGLDDSGNGAAQLSVPQQNQQPLGSSNGS